MQEQAIKRLSNEQVLPEFVELQRDIDRCIKTANAKQAYMRGRFGTFELTMGIAKLQEAKLWIDQVVFRLGYKPHGE